jgi:hypothetical protein
MPRTCTICIHALRSEIEGALVTGTAFRNIAERFGTSSTALFRHKQHLGDTLAKAKEAVEASHGDNLLEKVWELETHARRIAKAAEDTDDLRTALMGVRELTRIVELLAKLKGDLDGGITVNVAAVGIEAVASMSLEEKELRVQNALAAVERLRAAEAPPPALAERGKP